MSRRPAAEVLAELEPLGIRLELDSFRALLAALGSPERGLAAVLVAGTNGKGSVAALLASIADAAGLRTGLYTSPHLERWHERIRVAGAEIGEAALAGLLEEVIGAARAAGAAPPTPFEAMTAAALLAFRRGDVELAVLEVGLGGRLDATNAVEPVLSVITRVALDHRELLGESLERIALEKAGIFRRGVDAVVAPQEPEAAAALATEAARVGARAEEVAGTVAIEAAQWRGLAGHRLVVRTPAARRVVDLALAGEHQIANAATAIRAAERLAVRFPALDDRAIATGLAAARWPGRLELLDARDGIDVLLDAAHNPDGCAALARFLARLGRPHALLFGALADKDAEAMLPPLARLAGAVVLTRPPSPRALAPEVLAPLVEGRRLSVVGEPAVAFETTRRRAVELAATGDRPLVVACGSIYLVGAVRALLGSGAAPD